MAVFKYKAYKEKEKTFVEGSIEAEDLRDARDKIRALGFLPTRVYGEISKDQQKCSEEKYEEQEYYVNRLSLNEKIQFTSELEVILSSQIPIIEALNMLSDNSFNLKIKSLVNGLRKSIQHGSSLKEALEKYYNVFDEVYIGLVTAGEMSGDIEKTFSRILELQNKQKKIKEKIISASIYPAILILMIIAVIALFGLFIIPKFAGMYMDMGVNLPLGAQIILGMTTFMQHYWFVTIAVFVSLGYGLYKAFKTSIVKKWIDKFLLGIPFIANFVKTVNLSNFISVMEVAYDAGIPIVQSIQMASTTIKNHVIKDKALSACKYLNKGLTLHDSFSNVGLIDRQYLNLILTGEKSGELGKMLNQMSDIFDKKVNMVTETLARSFEPIMIVIMGIIIGILAISMYPIIFGGPMLGF